MHAYTLIIVYILLCICFFPPSYGYISNIKRIQFWKAITLVSLCSSLKRHLLPKESQQIIASFCQSPMTPFRKKWTWEIKNNVTLWEKRTTEMPNPVVWQDISREARIRTTQITESNSRNWRPFKCGKGRCKGSVCLFFSRICGKGGELSDSVYLQKMPSWSGKEQICQSHCIGGESEDFALHRWRLLWQGPPICALVRHCPGLDLAKKKKKSLYSVCSCLSHATSGILCLWEKAWLPGIVNRHTHAFCLCTRFLNYWKGYREDTLSIFFCTLLPSWGFFLGCGSWAERGLVLSYSCQREGKL